MKSKTTLLLGVVTVALVLNPLAQAIASVVTSREELAGQLGAAAITENFEGFVLAPDTAARVGTVLDSNSVVSGQGPGLVQPGLRFTQSPAGEGLQWDRQFGYGLLSEALVSDNKMIVDFTTPVTHVGFDMFWYHTQYPPANPSTIQVFAADQVTLLYTTNIFEPFAPDAYFFGYANTNTIGRVILFRDEGGSLGVTALIDNLTFGFAPTLSATVSNQQLSLSWTQTATNYQLESATNTINPTSWGTVTMVPTPVNGQNTVMLPLSESSMFFRLHRQE